MSETFSARLRRLGVVQDAPAPPPPDLSNVRALRGDETTAYALGALRGICRDMLEAGITGGRDIALNRACLRVGGLIRDYNLDRAVAVAELRAAAMSVSDKADFNEAKIEEKLGRVIDQGIDRAKTIQRGPAPDLAPPLREFTPQVPDETPEQRQAAADAAEEFWTARPVHEHLRTFARARMTSPLAVLGVTLARVCVATPPFVVLPPIVGSHASLNLFVALVGPSGGGKGAAESASADAYDVGEVEVATVGSGEGIGHLYAHREKGQVVRDRDAVLFTVPEVDNLAALGARQGATLMPQLRSAWSGEKLGFSYANKDKALPLDRHSYRMGLVLGVQPGRAAALLDDADGGTPQRFLWLPVTDAEAPDELPPCPPPQALPARRGPAYSGGNGLVTIPVCQVAKDTIVEARRARLRGDGDALDGHALLCRLKAAAALALLEGRWEVREDDWHLSGLIQAVSDHTRGTVVRHLTQVAAQANQAKGVGDAMRAVTVNEHVEQAAVRKTAATLGRRLRGWTERDGWAAHSELRRALTSPQRQHFEDAVEALLEAGQVERRDDGRGVQYRWKEGRS